MFKPIENLSIQNSPINTSQYNIPTREEIRSLRNLNDLTTISPYNESAIVPYVEPKPEPKIEPKEESKTKVSEKKSISIEI